jgi:hypothetical protein
MDHHMNRTFRNRVLVVFIAMLSLAACAVRDDAKPGVVDLFDAIQPGMSCAEVEAMLGPPTERHCTVMPPGIGDDVAWYLPPPEIGLVESPFAAGTIGIDYSPDNVVIAKRLNPQWRGAFAKEIATPSGTTRAANSASNSASNSAMAERASMSMTNPYVDAIFGPLRMDDGGYWSKVAKYGSGTIELDLNIDGAIDAAAVERLTSRLRGLPGLDARARAAMQSNGREADSAVLLFRSHCTETLAPEVLVACLGPMEAWRTNTAAFVASLRLKRVGLYPEDTQQSIVMDFTLRDDVTTYLVCVSFDGDGNMVSVEMES